jgi:hypothetical protein
MEYRHIPRTAAIGGPIQLPASVMERLRALAATAGLSPDELVARWVIERTGGGEEDNDAALAAIVKRQQAAAMRAPRNAPPSAERLCALADCFLSPRAAAVFKVSMRAAPRPPDNEETRAAVARINRGFGTDGGVQGPAIEITPRGMFISNARVGRGP